MMYLRRRLPLNCSSTLFSLIVLRGRQTVLSPTTEPLSNPSPRCIPTLCDSDVCHYSVSAFLFISLGHSNASVQVKFIASRMFWAFSHCRLNRLWWLRNLIWQAATATRVVSVTGWVDCIVRYCEVLRNHCWVTLPVSSKQNRDVINRIVMSYRRMTCQVTSDI